MRDRAAKFEHWLKNRERRRGYPVCFSELIEDEGDISLRVKKREEERGSFIERKGVKEWRFRECFWRRVERVKNKDIEGLTRRAQGARRLGRRRTGRAGLERAGRDEFIRNVSMKVP
jgi:hypothetical protein